MARYRKYRILTNSGEYYKELRDRRDLKTIRHYETPVISNPSVADRTRLVSNAHIWKYGDRLYKLADQYYNDSRFWWVIAWYNGIPCEAEIPNGTVLAIPVNIEETLKVLGVA